MPLAATQQNRQLLFLLRQLLKIQLLFQLKALLTEALLLTFSQQPTVFSPSIRVLRNFNSITSTIAEYPILVKDTTIIDDDNGIGLLLDTTYTYFAVRVDSLGQLKDTSNIVTQKTLAPTSHNYTWQEFTIGDAGFSNALYDVWGTDENNVWALVR